MKGGNDDYDSDNRRRTRRRCVGGSVYYICGP